MPRRAAPTRAVPARLAASQGPPCKLSGAACIWQGLLLAPPTRWPTRAHPAARMCVAPGPQTNLPPQPVPSCTRRAHTSTKTSTWRRAARGWSLQSWRAARRRRRRRSRPPPPPAAARDGRAPLSAGAVLRTSCFPICRPSLPAAVLYAFPLGTSPSAPCACPPVNERANSEKKARAGVRHALRVPRHGPTHM